MKSFDFKVVAVGIFLGLAALLAGEILGMAFGAKEDAIKSSFKQTAAAAAQSSGLKDPDKAASGAWKYLKRAHMHFMGLGATALALAILAGLSPAGAGLKFAASSAVGFGAFVYPLFWFFTALKTAEAGKHAAKESLALMAQAGAGAGFIGLLMVIAICAMWLKSGGGETE